MNICETCKHFDAYSKRGAEHTNWGECANPKLQDVNADDDGLSGDCLDEGLVTIQVGPKFGCIHHESK